MNLRKKLSISLQIPRGKRRTRALLCLFRCIKYSREREVLQNDRLRKADAFYHMDNLQSYLAKSDAKNSRDRDKIRLRERELKVAQSRLFGENIKIKYKYILIINNISKS